MRAAFLGLIIQVVIHLESVTLRLFLSYYIRLSPAGAFFNFTKLLGKVD